MRFEQRDIHGLALCAEHYGAPYDLLAAALDAQPARLRGITSRWRRAGYAATGRLGPGPAWCWLTPTGMSAAGFSYRAGQPSLARLAHIRAVLAARLWLAASPAWEQSRPWWESERRIRAAHPGVGAAGHLPDAEIHWPGSPACPYAGQVWAVEVEADRQGIRPDRPDHGRAAGRTRTVRAGALPDRAARPARGHPGRSGCPRGLAGPDHRPRPALVGVHPGRHVMTVWSWLRFTLTLWLLRKAVKAAGWLLLLILAVALWPVTVVTAAGYVAAWLRPAPGRTACATRPCSARTGHSSR